MAKTYFISGHRDITDVEFVEHYEPILWKIICDEEDAKFVVGDCQGADNLAQKYLKALGLKEEITVYHMLESPRYNAGFKLIGGFNSDIERDFAMTQNSDTDIAWVRKGSERSGTQQNLDRRNWMNERITKGLPVSLAELDKREANNFI